MAAEMDSECRHLESDQQQQVHLVTGGGGYPGFHLARALARKGHRVIILDVRLPAGGEPLPPLITFIQVGQCGVMFGYVP